MTIPSFGVDFGAGNSGLVGTLGVTEYDAAGAVNVARTTVGIVEAAQGVYYKQFFPDADTVLLQWDTGGGTPIYASENVDGMLGELHARMDLNDNKRNTYQDDRSAIDNDDFTLTKTDIGGGEFEIVRTESP